MVSIDSNNCITYQQIFKSSTRLQQNIKLTAIEQKNIII